MTVIDTSVWVSYFRGRDQLLIRRVHELLDTDHVALVGPIRIELLSGARRDQAAILHRVLAALPTYYPAHATWDVIEHWIDGGLKQGHRFGAMDLLIAAIAHEHNAQLWSLDGDFHRMEHLGWIHTFQPS